MSIFGSIVNAIFGTAKTVGERDRRRGNGGHRRPEADTDDA